MKINIVNPSEVNEVGDAYVVSRMTNLYTDTLIVNGEDGTYVACGTYDKKNNKFTLLDVERPAYFVSADKEFSYEKLMELVDTDDLGDYASESEFTIE